MVQIKELEKKAVEVRRRTIEIVHNASGGHIGGSLSAVDILVALHFGIMNIDPEIPEMKGRDRFILSKGHTVESYYATLEKRGFISSAMVDTYGQFDSQLAGHPTRKVPGIELNSGALGHGLSVGVGLSLAAKRTGESYRTYVLMGDGEHGEGSIMDVAEGDLARHQAFAHALADDIWDAAPRGDEPLHGRGRSGADLPRP